MYRSEKDGSIRIKAARYEVEIDRERVDVILAGERAARLTPVSAVNVLRDGEEVKDTAEIVSLSEKEEERAYVFTWRGKSSVWSDVEFVLRATELYLEYFVRVAGDGDVDSVEYFGGCGGSEYEFDRGFTPIPTVDGSAQCEFSAQKAFDEFSFLTIPPLFTYVFDVCGINKKITFALAADAGEHNFTKFAYCTGGTLGLRRFWFSTDQLGHTCVKGEWNSPSILIYGADTRYDAMKYYADYYFTTGKAQIKPSSRRPRFWYGPAVCGWIEQAAYSEAKKLGISQPEMARQDTYDNFNLELERRDLHPTIMIIDDKWQTAYGDPYANTEKWPDLRRWIDENREERGRHTMLWYKLWDSEGLPDDECMKSESQYNARCADPTNPKYRERLREIMHRLISSDKGCYNADGLKLDFAFFQPTGRSAVSYDGRYGVELFLEYIKTIYEFVKAEKPEAIISASPCHPLFAKYIDHARLHDYHPDLRRNVEEFTFRRELYHIALPWSLVDTDGAGFRVRRDTMRYLCEAQDLGIPDLYCITDMPGIHLTDDDWKTVSNVWREYSEWADRIAELR
ncbi:MAG: hypothetical protein IKN38_06330 [Clostridia bacterium]|nr:hypothetical protein [Clostridia bacterium]